MCLEQVFTKKEREEVLAKLPDEFAVWKVVYKCDGGRYITDCQWYPLHAGEVTFKQNIIDSDDFSYRGGGHFWLKKEAADAWCCRGIEKVVRCRVKKEWIMNVGYQRTNLLDAFHAQIGNVVVVVKKAIFPKYIGEICQCEVKN